jgi:hypothetical protein
MTKESIHQFQALGFRERIGLAIHCGSKFLPDGVYQTLTKFIQV